MTEQTEIENKTPNEPPRLPRSMVIAIAVVITILLAFNVVCDILVGGYSGYPTTLMLGTILGGLLGIHRYLRIGGGP